MPNYAYTDYYITGSNSDISNLYDALISLDAHPNVGERSKNIMVLIGGDTFLR